MKRNAHCSWQVNASIELHFYKRVGQFNEDVVISLISPRLTVYISRTSDGVELARRSDIRRVLKLVFLLELYNDFRDFIVFKIFD
ncbi:hypothetical protein [Pseudomonas viridiflava]|uniref:hypothetical protein n=1 Tax=Pseudomonas viridiflava TaxID=33069 RepID=UPI0004730C9A|nr:hypothetical protein [Pseudomonas viridiflava]